MEDEKINSNKPQSDISCDKWMRKIQQKTSKYIIFYNIIHFLQAFIKLLYDNFSCKNKYRYCIHSERVKYRDL